MAQFSTAPAIPLRVEQKSGRRREADLIFPLLADFVEKVSEEAV
jgi:hypothetical protein